jgi:hypothetical protein
MPNVTITVPDDLKAEMDKLAEVSWSEICRNAIAQYISQRKDPTPKIELDIRSSRMNEYDFDMGYPTLTIDIRIQNRMSSEITVDRALATAWGYAEGGHTVAFGQANDLYKRIISSNSAGVGTVRFVFPIERLRELRNKFKSTFDCHVRFTVFADGFKNPYSQELVAQVPIDVWNSVLRKALGTSQAAQ